MKPAIDVRVGNILRLEGKVCKVLSQEVKGTGKSSKMVHIKVRFYGEGNLADKSLRSDERVEECELEHIKMQYSYKDGEQFIFMNLESFEQFSLPAAAVGRQEAFLKENMEIDMEFIDGKPVNVAFPKIAELEVVSAPPPLGGDANYKEAELENGLKMLVPQFVKSGDRIRVDVENLAYMERVTTKSLTSSQPAKQPQAPKA